MKALFSLFAAALFSLSMIGSAEAAKVLVLPAIINVNEAECNATIEEINQTYYNQVVDSLKNAPDMEMIDGDEIEKKVNQYTDAKVLPNEKQLAELANEVDADIILQMELNKLEENRIVFVGDEYISMNMQGFAVSYDRNNKKAYQKHRIYDDSRVDSSLMARSNFSLEQWRNAVTQEANRIIGVKKIIVQKPRLSKLK